MKRRRRADKEAPAVPAAGGPGRGHAACRARAGELEARLAAAEASASELRGRLAASEATASELRTSNEALARDLASAREQAELASLGGGFSHLGEAVEKGRALRRDFGAELPPGVLLLIMDRASDRKCVVAGIMF